MERWEKSVNMDNSDVARGFILTLISTLLFQEKKKESMQLSMFARVTRSTAKLVVYMVLVK